MYAHEQCGNNSESVKANFDVDRTQKNGKLTLKRRFKDLLMLPSFILEDKDALLGRVIEKSTCNDHSPSVFRWEMSRLSQLFRKDRTLEDVYLAQGSPSFPPPAGSP